METGGKTIMNNLKQAAKSKYIRVNQISDLLLGKLEISTNHEKESIVYHDYTEQHSVITHDIQILRNAQIAFAIRIIETMYKRGTQYIEILGT